MTDPMNELDRELSAAMQVEPSPEFAARVRARVATEAPVAEWRMPRPAFAAMALAALVVIMVRVWPYAPDSRASRAPVLSARPSAIAELPRAVSPLSPSIAPIDAPKSSTGSNVIVSRSEMLALQRLFSGTTVIPAAAEAAAEELSIPEIAIDPIPVPANVSGEKQ